MTGLSLDGVVNLVVAALAPFMVWRNLRIRNSEALLREYIETAPKARRLKEKLGVEGAMELTRRRYLPIGIATWAVIGALSIYLVIARAGGR